MQIDKVSKVFQALGSYQWDAEETVNVDNTWSLVSCPLAPFTHSGSGKDVNPSFSVNVESGHSPCKCFTCGFSGSISSLVSRVFSFGGIDEVTKNELLAYINVEKNRGFETITKTYTPELPSFLRENFNKEHSYFTGRGLDASDVTRWSLGYSDDLERVLVPFYSHDGTLQAVVGRTIAESFEPKYKIYPSGFPRSKYLFGEKFLREDEKIVLVVEGLMDTIIASKYLPDIGVVGLGTALASEKQIRTLVGLAPEICLGLDNDEAGGRGFERIYNALRGRCKLSRLDFRQFKDPAEAGQKLPIIFEHREKMLTSNALSSTLQNLTSRRPQVEASQAN